MWGQVVLPTNAAAKSTNAHNHTEEMSVFTPKAYTQQPATTTLHPTPYPLPHTPSTLQPPTVSLMGKPTLVPAASAFDFAFGEGESNEVAS